mgnify:CR=1 FL=1
MIGNHLFTEALRAMAEAASSAESDAAGQLTLGVFVEKLKQVDPTKVVLFSDGRSIGAAHSYRGYYEQLAFRPCATTSTVGDVLRDAKTALGSTFQGYKGGDYRMSARTWIWASEYGEASGDRIVDVLETPAGVIVKIKRDDAA